MKLCKNPGSRDYWIGRDWSVAAGNVCRPLRKRRLRPSEHDDGLGPRVHDDDDAFWLFFWGSKLSLAYLQCGIKVYLYQRSPLR